MGGGPLGPGDSHYLDSISDSARGRIRIRGGKDGGEGVTSLWQPPLPPPAGEFLEKAQATEYQTTAESSGDRAAYISLTI